jgi:hypothetical protein
MHKVSGHISMHGGFRTMPQWRDFRADSQANLRLGLALLLKVGLIETVPE